MALALRGSATGVGSSATLTTSAMSTTAQAGDIVILFAVGTLTTGTFTTPTGFTALTAQNPGGTQGPYSQVFWKIAGASEPTTYSVTSSATTTWDIAALAYSGVAAAGVDHSAGTIVGANASSIVMPTVTATNPTWVIELAAEGGGSSDTLSAPAGFTTRLNFQNGLSCAVIVCDKSVSAGTVGGDTVTSLAGHRWAGYSITLAVGVPAAPTVTAPTGTALPGALTVSWTYNDGGFGLAQTAYAIKRSSDGGATFHWYNGTDWSSTVEVFVTSAAASVSTPSWTGQASAWQFAVATQNANGAGPYSANGSVAVHDLPTLSGVVPAASAVVNSGGPNLTVSWTYAQAQGVAQQSFRIQVQSAGGGTTYYDTGTLPSAATSISGNAVALGIPTDTTGSALQVVVTVTSTDGFSSAATTHAFDIQWGVVTAAVTAPLNNATISASAITGTWTFASTRGFTQQSYRVRLYITGTGVNVFDTGTVPSTALTLLLPYVLSDNTRYTLGVVLTNSQGVASTEAQVQFVVDMTTPAQYPTEQRVGDVYQVAINGVGYMLADDPTGQEFRYRRVTVPLELTRFASGVSPFEEAIEHYLYAGLYSWVDGAGQTHLDRPEASATRYLDSDGVNPFVANQLTLLHTTAGTVTSTDSSPQAVTAAGNLYVGAGTTALKFTSTLAGTGTTITLTANLVSLASDGQQWYAVESDGKVYKGTTTAGSVFSAAGSGLPASSLAKLVTWAGQRVCVSYLATGGNYVFSTLNASGVEEVTNGRLTLPLGWTLSAMSGGQAGHVWFSANSNDQSAIYKWDLSSSSPSLALDMPIGETVTALLYYQGNLMIRTSYALSGGNTGGRIYRAAVDASTGNLTPELIVDMADSTGAFNNGSGSFGAYRDFVFWGWSGMDGTHVGIGALDLSLGGYTKWLVSSVSGDHLVGAIVPFQGATCFAVGGTGLFVEQLTTYRTAGTVTTSIIDKQSALQKVWEQTSVLMNNPLASGESVQVAYSLDGGSTFTTLAGATMNQAGQQFVQAVLSKKSNRIQFKVTLGSGGTSTPNLMLITTRVRQTGIADVELEMPIDCRDWIKGLNGQDLPENGSGIGAARARTLEALAQTRVAVQDLDWQATATIYTFDVSNVDVRTTQVYNPSTGRQEVGAVAILTLRGVAK